MEGKIIFEEKTSKGLSITVRYPKKDDLNILCEFINTLSKEHTFIHFQGETVTLKEEKEWLTKRLKEISSHKAVHLLVFSGEKLIGGSDILLKEFTSKHEGVFGIVVLREYRHQGLGQLLMKLVLNEALQYIPNLRLITLEVFEDNNVARDLYESLGFSEYGRLPEGVYRKGEYKDCIHMFKKVK